MRGVKNILRCLNECFSVINHSQLHIGPASRLCWDLRSDSLGTELQFCHSIISGWLVVLKALHRVRTYTSQIAMFMGPTWDHLGPVGPRWAPCWSYKPCCQGYFNRQPLEETKCHYCSLWMNDKMASGYTANICRSFGYQLLSYWAICLVRNINPFHYIVEQNDSWYTVLLPRYRWSCYINIVYVCTYDS